MPFIMSSLNSNSDDLNSRTIGGCNLSFFSIIQVKPDHRSLPITPCIIPYPAATTQLAFHGEKPSSQGFLLILFILSKQPEKESGLILEATPSTQSPVPTRITARAHENRRSTARAESLDLCTRTYALAPPMTYLSCNPRPRCLCLKNW